MARIVSTSILLFAVVCALLLLNTTALKWCPRKSVAFPTGCATGELCNTQCKAENGALGGACEEGPDTINETRFKYCLSSRLEAKDFQMVQACFNPLSDDRRINPILRACILRRFDVSLYRERLNTMAICEAQSTQKGAIACYCGFLCAGTTVVNVDGSLTVHNALH